MYILVEDVLKRAHVPPRQGVYVERKVMIQKIRNELYKLKDQDGCELNYIFCIQKCPPSPSIYTVLGRTLGFVSLMSNLKYMYMYSGTPPCRHLIADALVKDL